MRKPGPRTSPSSATPPGTTGPPKGALHAQRVFLGHIPGVQLFYDFWPQPGDRIWTPSDWAWLGGLGNVMMPALRMGVPLVAHAPRRFDPEHAVRLIAEHGVTSAFLAPTALRLLRQLPSIPALPLRSVGSGGESLGAGDARLGARRAGADDQRVLRPDRVQPRARQLRAHPAGAAGIDRKGDAGQGGRGAWP